MFEILTNFYQTTGLAQWLQGIELGQVVMIAVACIFLYLAIVKEFEPLLLLPIAFGMLLTNLPLGGIMAPPKEILQMVVPKTMEEMQKAQIMAQQGQMYAHMTTETPGSMPGGLLYYIAYGEKLGIFPPLIFLGVGAMTDFGPLIANPKSLLLGAAAQIGVYITFVGAVATGLFTAQEAGSIGIIGGADGPTAIYLAAKMAPHLMGPIAVAAYSYMALVPVIQPPIMRALTTPEERVIVMKQLRVVSKKEKIIFPIIVTIVVSLILPPATPLIGMLMLGNLFRESGVVSRLTETASNALMNIIVIFLGVSVGATATAREFIRKETLVIVALGVLAFAFGTGGGVLLAKLMNKLSPKDPVNPLIGSAGVSAVPMAARVSNKVGLEYDPSNFLLMHAMGPNVAGVIGTAVAAGVLLSLFGS